MHGPSSAPPARPSHYRTALIAAAALAVGVGGTLAFTELARHGGTKPTSSATQAVATPSPTAAVMSGHIALSRYDKGEDPAFRVANWTRTSSGGCAGQHGYDDMREGADVTVYDANGKVIGASSLEAGLRSSTKCRWAFSVQDLPASPFYQVEVSHRGKVTVQRGDVGFAELTLGS